MITNNQVILAACVSASVAFLVGIITAFVNMRTNARARKNEKKLAVLKILLDAAYKEYEFRTKQDLEEARLNNKKARIKSFTEYIIFYQQMGLIFEKEDITREDIIGTMRHNKTLIDTYYKKRDEFRPEYHKHQ